MGHHRSRSIVAKALESGADDYLVKPLSPIELVARVRLALRRREEPEPFVVGGPRHRLRLQLGDSADSPTYVFNQRGVGYRMAAPSGSRPMS